MYKENEFQIETNINYTSQFTMSMLNFLSNSSNTYDITTTTISNSELDLIRLITRILSGISITGLLLVQIIFWFFKPIRSFAFELVAWLCISNIFFNISNFFPVYESDNIASFNNGTLSSICEFQALINIMFDLSSMLWTTIIGFTAYISVSKQQELQMKKMKYRLGFIFIAYVLPLTFVLM
jgi:hypothetical protein